MSPGRASDLHRISFPVILVSLYLLLGQLCMIGCSPDTNPTESEQISQARAGHQQTRSYMIKRATTKVPLSGQVLGTPWSQAEILQIDNYPWFESGQKELTTVRMLYDDEAVYIQFSCEDESIYAVHSEVNSEVWADSCVEFFAMPNPDNDDRYFNAEFNCIGAFLFGWGRNLQENCFPPVEPEITTRHLEISASVPGPVKEESTQDDGWWVAARIPFELISELSGSRVQPASGTKWRANFYRCGGKTNIQYACWNWIDTPKPDYHRPEFFGEIVFE